MKFFSVLQTLISYYTNKYISLSNDEYYVSLRVFQGADAKTEIEA